MKEHSKKTSSPCSQKGQRRSSRAPSPPRLHGRGDRSTAVTMESSPWFVIPLCLSEKGLAPREKGKSLVPAEPVRGRLKGRFGKGRRWIWCPSPYSHGPKAGKAAAKPLHLILRDKGTELMFSFCTAGIEPLHNPYSVNSDNI